MDKKAKEVFVAWLLIDTVGVGVGIKEYIEIETDLEKKEVATETLNKL